MPNNQLRKLMRYVHLIAGIYIATYLYSPLSDLAAAEWTLKVVIIPLISVTGLFLWQQPLLTKWVRRNRSVTS
jgi:hypothetical protein